MMTRMIFIKNESFVKPDKRGVTNNFFRPKEPPGADPRKACNRSLGLTVTKDHHMLRPVVPSVRPLDARAYIPKRASRPH